MGNTITFSIAGQTVLISICIVVSLFLAYVVVLQKKILSALSELATSKRISTILKFEGKKITSIPSDFEPNKKVIEKRLLDMFREKNHPEPETRAFCILKNAGWQEFVDGDTRSAAQKALARLITNGDDEKIQTFLKDLANQL